LADRIAWNEAIADGDILEGRGPAAHWAPATKETNEYHYSRWLGYLQHRGWLDAERTPSTRVTPDRVRAFVKHLRSEVAPRTVVCTLVGLKVTLKAMHPRTDWRWLADICNALNRTSKPQKDKRSRMRPAEEIYSAAIAELKRLLKTQLSRRIERVAFRDRLMLALMIARPLRLKNFVRMRLGKHLIRERTGWTIRIAGADVKNKQPLEFSFPESLVPFLEVYLDRVRLTFMRRGQSDILWLGYLGAPLTAHGAYHRYILLTKRLLNVVINPHLLRDCAATSLAMESPSSALAAGALLGHRNFSTTQRYYIHANRLQASRALNTILASLQHPDRN
jgi:site-specific recombinase XerD